MTLESVPTQTAAPSTVPNLTKIAADALAGGEIVQYMKLVDAALNSEVGVLAPAGALYVDVRALPAGGVAINDGAGSITVDGVFWPATPATEVGTVRIKDSFGNSLQTDQKPMANSLPVVIASDQTAIPVRGVVLDNAGFTDGTTPIQPAGFIFDEAVGIALTENDAAAARIDSKRAQVLVLEDANTRGRRAIVTGTGELFVTGSGSAGLPGTGVLTVQGAAAGIPLPMSMKRVDGADISFAGGSLDAGTQRVVLANTQPTLNVQGAGVVGSVIAGNPVPVGAVARNAEQAAAGNDTVARLVTDLVGKLIVLPYANPENLVQGAFATAVVDTTSTPVIGASGTTGIRNYVTSLTITNAHATVGTLVKLLDGATLLWQGYAAPGGGGMTVNFPTPLKGSGNTAINAQAVITGASLMVSASGYRGV